MLRGRIDETKNGGASPFGPPTTDTSPFQIPIVIMLLVTVVFTAFFSMILLAARIPEVQGMLASLFGGTKGERTTEHESQLRFLMVCYSAPLILTGVAGLIYYFSTLMQHRNPSSAVDDDEGSFS